MNIPSLMIPRGKERQLTIRKMTFIFEDATRDDKRKIKDDLKYDKTVYIDTNKVKSEEQFTPPSP